MRREREQLRSLAEADIALRVRYAECDPMNVAHHAAYPVWLEIARTDLLRQQGLTYKGVEAAGIYIVVAELNIRYRKPAFYDDALRVHVRLLESAGVRIEHDYGIYRDQDLLAQARTTLVCVDRTGRPCVPPAGILPAAPPAG